MKLFKSLLIVLIMLANLVAAQPAVADKPKFTKNPDYIEVTKTLNNLYRAKDAQAQGESSSEEIQKKIEQLKLQRYTLETGVNWGQCRNETGKTLGVYGPKLNEDDDDDDSPYGDNALYFLADGQTTKNNWDCDGVYLPNDVKTTGISPSGRQELVGPVVIKIADGTKLVVKANPDTAAVEFNIPPTKVFKAGEVNWFIPNVSQAVIDTLVTNAPAAKIPEGNKLAFRSNLEPAVVESNIPPKTQPQPQPESQPQPQPQPQSQLQPQPQPQPQQILPNMRIKWKNR